MAVDQDLARTMLNEAATRYESAGRWALILCAVVFVFHILTFSPFIRAQAARAALAEQIDILDGTSTDLGAMLDVQQAAMDAVRGDLDAMLKRMKEEFGFLQRAIETIRTAPAPGAGQPPSAGLPPQPPRPMVQMQMQAAPAGSQTMQEAHVESFIKAIRTDNLTDLVRDAPGGQMLRDVLRPLIEQKIIGPQFATVTASWKARLPDLLGKTDAVRASLVRLTALFPAELRWPALRARIDAYRAALDKVTFGPPADDPNWWYTTAGKGAAVLKMKDIATDRLTTPSFREAHKALRALLDERAHLVAGIDDRLSALERQFEAQKEKLGELIAPVKGLAFDLSVVSANFPLVLALLLAAALVWPARRYDALRSAATLARRAGLIDQDGADALLHPGGMLGSAAVLTAQAVLFVAWCLAAAWQLRDWPGREGLDLPLLTGLAVAIVVGAALYKAQVLRGASSQEA